MKRVLIVGDHPHADETGTVGDSSDPDIAGMWRVELDSATSTYATACYAELRNLRFIGGK